MVRAKLTLLFRGSESASFFFFSCSRWDFFNLGLADLDMAFRRNLAVIEASDTGVDLMLAGSKPGMDGSAAGGGSFSLP